MHAKLTACADQGSANASSRGNTLFCTVESEIQELATANFNTLGTSPICSVVLVFGPGRAYGSDTARKPV